MNTSLSINSFRGVGLFERTTVGLAKGLAKAVLLAAGGLPGREGVLKGRGGVLGGRWRRSGRARSESTV